LGTQLNKQQLIIENVIFSVGRTDTTRYEAIFSVVKSTSSIIARLQLQATAVYGSTIHNEQEPQNFNVGAILKNYDVTINCTGQHRTHQARMRT